MAPISRLRSPNDPDYRPYNTRYQFYPPAIPDRLQQLLQADLGDEESDEEEDTLLINATTDNNPENEDPSLENVTVESDSEYEDDEEEEITVLAKAWTSNDLGNMELHELTEDKQDDNQDQLELDLEAEFAIQEKEERQQAAHQGQLGVELEAWLVKREEEQRQQHPTIIDLAEEDQAADQNATEDFVRKAILLSNPQTEHDNKSTLSTTSSYYATVNKALDVAFGKRPVRKNDSRPTNSASINSASATAPGKRPARSSIDEDQQPKRQCLDPEPVALFPVINQQEYKAVVCQMAQDLFEIQIPHLQQQYPNGNIHAAVISGLQNDCVQKVQVYVTGIYQQGKQQEVIDAQRFREQERQARKMMAAQQQNMHPNPVLHMLTPQYQQHIQPAPQISAPQQQQHMMHPDPAPHMSAPQYQQYMQQNYAAPIQQRQQPSGVMSAQ